MDAADLFEGYAALVQLVVPAVVGPVIVTDPDDDIVLATAVAGDADLIVSSDAHLLGIGKFEGIPVLRPSAVVSRLVVRPAGRRLPEGISASGARPGTS
jgi:predicted nucleic acid-binding protein